MSAFGFAWLSLIRQPARSSLGILGVAAVGALLFDMLLLSEGLITSMRDLFDRAGFDIRITATDALPGQGPSMPDGVTAASEVAAIPAVRAAIALRFVDATIEAAPGRRTRTSFHGVTPGTLRPWSIVRGRDVRAAGELVINENNARVLGVEPGTAVRVSPVCVRGPQSLPPVTLTVVGIATFPFDAPQTATALTSMATLVAACGERDTREADVIMAASSTTTSAAVTAIRARRPDLRVLTNEELVGRFESGGFSYFRQISVVLTTVTVAFAVLLITVLLTVSVNQRLGEIAALRALGFTRARVVADVLWESAIVVGAGGLLSLPLGALLAVGLDAILKNIPGIPTDVHFFVYRGDALLLHLTLLAATALVAALYPMYTVARLPIAGTLRDEVVG